MPVSTLKDKPLKSGLVLPLTSVQLASVQMAAASTRRSRAWCLTDFQPENAEDYYELVEENENIVYFCMGHEVCDTTGRLHLQGYVYFRNGKVLAAVKRFFHPFAPHLEAAKGTAEQSRIYCKKEGDEWFEYGDMPEQGKRNDLDAVREQLTADPRMGPVMDHVRSYQAARFGEMFLRYKEQPRPLVNLDLTQFEVNVIWCHGPPDTGKTRWAFAEYPDLFRPLSEKWWDGYDGHETVLLDDFRSNYCSFTRLLHLLDNYPFRVECKGGSRQVQYETIIITSCYHPEDCYSADLMSRGENMGQLLRRITTIKPFMAEEVQVPAAGYVAPLPPAGFEAFAAYALPANEDPMPAWDEIPAV